MPIGSLTRRDVIFEPHTWYQELARLVGGSKPPTMETLFGAGRRYDSVFMPELAPRLIQKFGLKLEIPRQPATP